MSAEETPYPRAGNSPNQRSQTPCRDRPRTGAGSNLAVLLFFQKPLQVDTADGSGGSIKASAHLDFLAHLLSQLGGNVESLRLAVNQHGDLELRVKALAVGAMAVGPAAGAFAFDKRAGQHFAERTEAADKFAAQLQIGFAGRFYMTLIIVSEYPRSQAPLKIARMPANCSRSGKPCKQTG